MEKSRVMDFDYCNLREIVGVVGGESISFINWPGLHSDSINVDEIVVELIIAALALHVTFPAQKQTLSS